MSKIRTYSELKTLKTFEDRLNYLSLVGSVGEVTFGFDRWINQQFYRSRQWKQVRQQVIFRDNGCDLGVSGYEILLYLVIHHMNPITSVDIIQGTDFLLNPDYLITTTRQTHNAIHYGNPITHPKAVVERTPGDTTLW